MKYKIGIVVFLLLMSASYAFAYLDPGTGNVLINIIIASIGALLFSLRGLYYSIIKRGKKNQKNINNDKCDIALFSEGKAYWTTFKPIVEEFISRKQHFFYYSIDIEDPGLLIENEYMNSRFLGYGVMAKINFYKINTKVLLSTTPNIGTQEYPLRKPPNIKKLIHIFHSINDISAYRKGSLDFYDMVFMVGGFQEKSIREIEAARNLPRKELISLGLPYFDVFIHDKKDLINENSEKTILIGSSWGDKGCLQSYGSEFIKMIAEENYKIIVRPHPYSLKTEQVLLHKLERELNGYKNIVWDTAISPTESMNKADVLISDTSSIRFDFAFIYEKPVITLDIKGNEMPGFERDFLNEIWTDQSSLEIGIVVKREEINSINKYIKFALERYDSIKIKEVRGNTVANFGKAAPAIIDCLNSIIKD